MTLVIHDISFTPHPSTRNLTTATCSCGWTLSGPSLEVQSKAACHDLDVDYNDPLRPDEVKARSA